jgi:hypothetical protein
MAEASWPSPNHGSPARSVTDAEYVRLAPWSSDGVFPSASPVVYANSSGMQVHVRANQYALVRGHAWTSGTAEYNLTIGANASGSTRIDTVVLRLDRSTWDVTAAVRQGTPGAGAPALVRDTGDTGLWEIPIADVTVPNGAASIAAGNVKARTLYQAGGARSCSALADIQAALGPGDLVYETSTGRWIGWNGTAGQVLHQDTGWQPYNPASSKFSPGGFPLRARAINGVAYIKGNVLVEGTVSIEAGSSEPKVAQLPAGFAPAQDHIWLAPIGQSAAGRMRLYTSGLITITATPVGDVSPGQGVYLDTTYLLG